MVLLFTLKTVVLYPVLCARTHTVTHTHKPHTHSLTQGLFKQRFIIMVPIFSPMTCDGIVTLEKIIFATLWSLGDKNKEKSCFFLN